MAKSLRRLWPWPIALAEALLAGQQAPARAATITSALLDGDLATADAGTVAQAAGTLPAAGGTALYLEVSLNGTSAGLARFDLRDGALWASAATLRRLGLVVAPGVTDPVRLDGLKAVQVRYDVARQSVDIVAPLDLLTLPTQVLNRPRPLDTAASASPGLLLNYNLFASQRSGGSSQRSAATELRAFNGSGVLSNTHLSQLTEVGGEWQAHSVRLDTSWTMSFPDRMLTARLGDTLSAATGWSRATRIGGLQVGTNFALQPYRITTPLPAFFGAATLPSQVDLFINGQRQFSGEVPAGPFQLTTPPGGISGAGNARVVLTDALGQVTTYNLRLYNTPLLLQRGLADWSVELGAVRENYGITSFDYAGQPVASGTWRHGVSDHFTAEAHAEATRALTNLGLGGAWLLGAVGVVSGSVAASRHEGTAASQYSLGYSWNNERINLGASTVRAGSGYRDVAALLGPPPPRQSTSAQAGYSTDRFGTFGLSYAKLQAQGQPDATFGSANWYKSLSRDLALSFSATRFSAEQRSRSFFLSLNWTLDRNRYFSSGLQRDRDHTSLGLDAIQSVPASGGLGWRAQLRQRDGTTDGSGELDYLGRYGQLQAGVSATGAGETGYLGANGSLVLMDGGLFAARQIFDAFAVVSTEGVAGVPVRLGNNLVGTTDASGKLLVTRLNAYQRNQVGIDAMALPADVRIDRVDAAATPTDRAGIVVRFGITPIRAASIVLVDAAGMPLPLGSLVRVQGQAGAPALVGFEGAVYLETLDEDNVLQVETPAGECHVSFSYRRQEGTVPLIGPLTCVVD